MYKRFYYSSFFSRIKFMTSGSISYVSLYCLSYIFYLKYVKEYKYIVLNINMSTMIDQHTDLCASIKSKKEKNTQCPLKRKINSCYCGKHQKNAINYDVKVTNICECISNKDDTKVIFTKDELLYNVQENISMSVYTIRQSIKHCFLKKFIQTKQSKQCLILELKNILKKERYYINNEDHIIKLQSFMRMVLKRRRYLCFNDIDILSMESKMDIETPYLYILHHKNKKFAYDIRFLKDLLESKYSKCPYTFEEFDDNQKNSIHAYIEKLKNEHIILEEVVELSEEEIIENKVKELFYKINMLDNYTSHKWFLDLKLVDLMKLYIHAEDIWNYRTQLSVQAKQNIIGNQSIFNIPISIIRKEKSLNKMRNIMIHIFDTMVSNGNDIHEKKLGAILVLSALVEVSPQASYALPHLIQL